MKIDPNKFIVEMCVGGKRSRTIDNILDIDYTVVTLRGDGEILSHEIKDVTIEYIDESGILKTVYGPGSIFRFTKVIPQIPRKYQH